MDRLPEPLLLDILNRLEDSADVARCRIAFKGFNNVSSELRSINLQCKLREKYCKSLFKSIFDSTLACLNSAYKVTQPYKSIFLNLISNMKVIESVCISLAHPVNDAWYRTTTHDDLSDDAFVMKWLPRVAVDLKSLSLSSFDSVKASNILMRVSSYCHNLVELKVTHVARLSLDNLNTMPTLTSLTLESITLDDYTFSKLITCFPNLQVLNSIDITGLEFPSIFHLNMKSCHMTISPKSDVSYSINLNTPNLIRLRFESTRPIELNVTAPMLSHLHLLLVHPDHKLPVIMSENLKTVWLNSRLLGTLLDAFKITESVYKLTLDSAQNYKNNIDIGYAIYNGFRAFSNMSSLCMQPSLWTKLEEAFKSRPLWGMIPDGKKGLKSFSAYLSLVDPSLTFACVVCLLEKFIGSSEVSFLIHREVVGDVSKSFMSKCMGRWPELKWRWGSWREGMEDSIMGIHQS